MTPTLNIDKSNWKKYRFGDVAIQTKEVVDIENTTLDRYIAGEHIDSEDLHIRRWGIVGDGYLGPAFIRKFSKGDILYGSRRTYLKKVAIADFDGITANTTFVIKPTELIHPILLAHLMLSEKFTEYSVKNSRGSVNPYINWKDIADYEFLLPPLAEQQRLAELLWAADEMIEKEKRELEGVERMLQSILNENVNVEGQPKISYADLVEVNPSTKMEIEEVSLITMADVSESGDIINQEKIRVSDMKGKGLTPFQENDILFAKITPCMENGKGAIAQNLFNGFGLGSTEFHVLRPKLLSDLYYCYFLSKSQPFRKIAEKLMTGTAGQKRVQVEFFDFYKLQAPSKEQRKTIGERLFEVDSNISMLKRQISLSQQIEQELINKMF